MEFREKLLNETTGEIRPGNILKHELRGDIETITIDGVETDVQYYYVECPDSVWRKSEYYEPLAHAYRVFWYVNDTLWRTDNFREGSAIIIPEYSEPGHGSVTWTDDIPQTMPAQDITIHGTSEEVMYNVVYLIDYNNYTTQYRVDTYHYGDTITPAEEPTQSGYRFSGWSPALPQTMPAADLVVSGQFVANDEYVITYVITNEGTYATPKYKEGEQVTPMDYPGIREGYSWSGWIGQPDVMPAHDVTVTGEYVARMYRLIYVVDGNWYKTVEYAYGATITPEPYEAEGVTFTGWVNLPETMPAADLRIDGYTRTNSYTITYILDGETWRVDTYFYGDTIAEQIPAKEGYVFSGWTPEVPETMPAEDLVVTAEMIRATFKLTFGSNSFYEELDGTKRYIFLRNNVYNILYGDPITDDMRPTVVAQRDEQPIDYVEWRPNDNEVIPATMPARNITIDGNIRFKRHTLTLIVNDEIWKTQTYEYGQKVYVSDYYPIETGYTWYGWIEEIPDTMPNNDVVLHSYYRATGSAIRVYKSKWWTESTLERHQNDPDWRYFAFDTTAANDITYDEFFTKIDDPGDKYVYGSLRIEFDKGLGGFDMLYGSRYWSQYPVWGFPIDTQIPDYDYFDESSDNPYVKLQPDEDGWRTYDFKYVNEYGTKVFPSSTADNDNECPRNKYHVVLDGEKHFMYVVGRRRLEWQPSSYQQQEDPRSKHIIYATEPHDGCYIALPRKYTMYDQEGLTEFFVEWILDGTVLQRDTYNIGDTIVPPSLPELSSGYEYVYDDYPETMPPYSMFIRIRTSKIVYKNVTWIIVEDGQETVYRTDRLKVKSNIVPPEDETGSRFVWESYPATVPNYDVEVRGTREYIDYTLTWIFDGTTYLNETKKYGDAITEPSVETSETYEWNSHPATMPAANLTVTGGIKDKWYVEWNTDQGFVAKDYYTYGETILAPVSIDDIEWNTYPATMPAQNLSVYGVVRASGNYANEYLTQTAIDDSLTASVKMYFGDIRTDQNTPQFYYSLDNGSTWTLLFDTNDFTVSEIEDMSAGETYNVYSCDSTKEISIVKGHTIKYKCDADNFDVSTAVTIGSSGTGEYKLSGNLSSVVFGSNFSSRSNVDVKTDIRINDGNLKYANNLVIGANNVRFKCYNMFFDCSSLVGAPQLPATTLREGLYSYSGMFSYCTSLVDAPALPATTLVSGCYSNMFEGCTSLRSAPTLPATTLAANCYFEMFKDCTSLASAPSLPATTLANECYKEMFSGCTSLTSAPILSATTLAFECYDEMFGSCTSLASAPALPATTLANECYKEMFSGCTSLTSAPALPATILTTYCYSGMFSGCTSLTSAPALSATTLAANCYDSMFSGCTSLASAPALSATTLAEYCYSGMFINCTSLTSAPALPATTINSGCYYRMFDGCTSLVDAPELPATNLYMQCYSAMFRGCTSLTSAPALPATQSASNCYNSMFEGCTSLKEIRCNLTTLGASPTAYWVNHVSSTGTFYKNSAVSSDIQRGADTIPVGWTLANYS